MKVIVIKKIGQAFVLLFLFFLSCEKETPKTGTSEDDSEEIIKVKGPILVSVLENETRVAEGIKVITFPATELHTTNGLGQVELKNLIDGNYHIYAYIENYGSGKTTISVTDGFAQNIEVDLIPEQYIEPIVKIESPKSEAGFSENEDIVFEGSISDFYSSSPEIEFHWASDKDGILSGAILGNDGRTTLTTNVLSESEHFIELSATNKLGITTLDTLSINTLSPPIPLFSLEKNNDGSIKISWNNSPSDIEKIEIFRYGEDDNNPEEIIAGIAGSGIVNYTDNTVPFTKNINYFIKYQNSDGYTRNSEIATESGQSVFNYQVHQATLHPVRTLLYLRLEKRIVLIDYQTMSVVGEKYFEREINHFVIGNNGSGDELYVPSEDGNVYILDLATLQLKESFAPGRRVTSVVTDNSGLIFTSVDRFSHHDEPIRIYRRSDLGFVSEGGDNDRSMLKMLASNNEIIEITTRISPVDMDYYRFDTDGNFAESQSDKYHGDHRLDPYTFKISPTKNYLVTSSSGAIYSADPEMDYKGVLLDDQPGKFADFDFKDDGTQIYAGVSLSKSIFVYESATLSKMREIDTRGYPMFLMKKENKLIVLSALAPFITQNHYYDSRPTKFGIEIVNLD